MRDKIFTSFNFFHMEELFDYKYERKSTFHRWITKIFQPGYNSVEVSKFIYVLSFCHSLSSLTNIRVSLAASTSWKHYNEISYGNFTKIEPSITSYCTIFLIVIFMCAQAECSHNKSWFFSKLNCSQRWRQVNARRFIQIFVCHESNTPNTI